MAKERTKRHCFVWKWLLTARSHCLARTAAGGHTRPRFELPELLLEEAGSEEA
jgi:hypothetical protein